MHMEHHPPNERSNIEKDDDNANSNRKNQYVWDKGIKCNKLECNFIALDAVEYSKHISTCEGVSWSFFKSTMMKKKQRLHVTFFPDSFN